ncbi:MAG TPA: hypothetical protein VN642_01730 [Dongiaceae bacterium]|nr:hypothetical protein [Dongiaceae bacterium]
MELNELFDLYWRRIIPLGQTSSIAFPFSRLAGASVTGFSAYHSFC